MRLIRHRAPLQWAFALLAALAGAAAPAASVPAPAAAQARLYLTTEHSPPTSMMVAGVPGGSSTDKVRDVMARTGTAYDITMLPWKRAYTAALQRPDACVYSTTRTPDREKLFKWVGPLDEGEWMLFARADRTFSLHSIEDARGLRIGTYNGDARDEFLRGHGFTVDAAQDDSVNPQKLLMGRIDVWAVSVRAGRASVLQKMWSDRIVPVLSFHRIGVYLACNRAVPDALVARMNEALGAMARESGARRIDRRFDKGLPPP
ncbi:MAG: ABC transporter substrate-binding protein [Pseudomonadota bacterium]